MLTSTNFCFLTSYFVLKKKKVFQNYIIPSGFLSIDIQTSFWGTSQYSLVNIICIMSFSILESVLLIGLKVIFCKKIKFIAIL